jgi:D-3-phosphoglycerate dehydrogenase / 2-oxoglutarate reductase
MVLGPWAEGVHVLDEDQTVAVGEVLAVLTVDDTVPQPVLMEVAQEIGATSARAINLC